MPLSLNLANFSSRTIRTSVASGGVRRIAVNATASLDAQEGGLKGVYNAVLKFGQSLLSLVWQAFSLLLTIDWGRLWQQIVSGVQFLLNFNWNITDAEIDAQIKQAEIGLAAAKGSLAGQSLGFAVCGLVPAATIAVFNEPLALYMMKELGEEASEEIAQSLTNLISLQLRQTARIGFFNLFKNYRTLFRGAAIGFATVLVNLGMLTQESVDKATKKRNEPWSIASAFEESIESIKDPEDRAYAENFWDEFGEACIEAGFIVANSADSYFAMQQMANENILGSERIVEIIPNRNSEEEGNS